MDESFSAELFSSTAAQNLSSASADCLISWIYHEEHEVMEFDALSKTVIGCAIEVHRELGPGLLESTYEHCLAHELALNEIQFERQKQIPVDYKGQKIDCGYRIDLLVANQLIL